MGILHPVELAGLGVLGRDAGLSRFITASSFLVRVSHDLRASLLQRSHGGFCRFQQGCQVELIGSGCRPHLGPSLPGVS